MPPLDRIDPVRHLEQEVDVESGRDHVTGTAADEPIMPDPQQLTPVSKPRCGSAERELLDQPFCDAPLHRRAR